jgi:biopolymer transport protein ExbD
MKARDRRADEKAELQMTPMIDIVFQLLTFFIFTFKFLSPEGDFSIKMPLSAPSVDARSDIQLPPIPIRLTADAGGRLTNILLDQRDLGTDFYALHTEIRSIVGDEGGPGSIASNTEVELDCDYSLKFDNVVRTMTALSGYVDHGRVVKLIERIRFSPPDRQR